MLAMDFTMTAMNRPELVRRTLASFTDKLQGVDFKRCTLHINVDPLPEGPVSECEVIAHDYFGNVHLHKAAAANFPAAVKWCWSQPETSFFFHLEDDWDLLVPIDVPSMLDRNFSSHLQACVNLKAYDWPNGEPRICLSPALWRSDVARALSIRLSKTANPEKQLRPITAENPEGGKHTPYFGIQYPTSIVIVDTGRQWLAKSPYQKAMPVYFTKWERKHESGTIIGPKQNENTRRV